MFTICVSLFFQFYFILFYKGGVIYFNVRTKEIPDFRPSMKGLEDKGLWTLIKEEQVPHYNIEDPALPKSTTVFAFQVHHKERHAI